MSSQTYAYTGQLHVETCCNCGSKFGMDADLYRECRRDSSIWFYCPRGHRQHYADGENERLKREKAALESRLDYARKDVRRQREYAEHQERRAASYKGHLTRHKRRSAAGVCPCCSRTFKQLAAHMKRMHPGYGADAEGGA